MDGTNGRVNDEEKDEIAESVGERIRGDLIRGPLSQLNATMATMAALGNQSAQAINMAEDALRKANRLTGVVAFYEEARGAMMQESKELRACVRRSEELLDELGGVLSLLINHRNAPAKKAKKKGRRR